MAKRSSEDAPGQGRAQRAAVERLTALQAIARLDRALQAAGRAESTRRQRRWALEELLRFIATSEGRPQDEVLAVELLDAERCSEWLARAAAGATRVRESARAEASVAGQRSRADAVRALARDLDEEAPDMWVAQTAVHPKPSAVEAQEAVEGLTSRSERFANNALRARTGAESAVIAATGLPKRDVSALTVSDLHLKASPPYLRCGDVSLRLGDESVDALRRWLRVRAEIVRHLEGEEPTALWVTLVDTTQKGVDGANVTKKAGLPITTRGTHLQYQRARRELAMTGDDRLPRCQGGLRPAEYT